VVEQRFCKPLARGSNPLPGTSDLKHLSRFPLYPRPVVSSKAHSMAHSHAGMFSRRMGGARRAGVGHPMGGPSGSAGPAAWAVPLRLAAMPYRRVVGELDLHGLPVARLDGERRAVDLLDGTADANRRRLRHLLRLRRGERGGEHGAENRSAYHPSCHDCPPTSTARLPSLTIKSWF
jgi:hypothetical protein